MVWVPVVLFLGVFISGSRTQLVLTQPPSMTEPSGSTVKIPCAMSSGHSIDRERARWYQQKSEGVPQFVYHYYTSSDQGRGSGIPDRFTVTPDASKNLWNLVITGVQSEDEAYYYCNTWDYLTGSPTASTFVFGGGTYMFISGQPAPPTVFLYPPSPEEIKSRSKATLVCLVNGFHPGVVTVSWTVDGTPITSGVETTKPTKQGDKYLASSYLTLNDSEWETDKLFTCKVTHEGKPYEKSVKRSECS